LSRLCQSFPSDRLPPSDPFDRWGPWFRLRRLLPCFPLRPLDRFDPSLRLGLSDQYFPFLPYCQ
jgi:hypothetical protein